MLFCVRTTRTTPPSYRCYGFAYFLRPLHHSRLMIGRMIMSMMMAITATSRVEGAEEERLVVPWCSGYHVCLTRRRSPVRNWAEPLGNALHCVRLPTHWFEAGDGGIGPPLSSYLFLPLPLPLPLPHPHPRNVRRGVEVKPGCHDYPRKRAQGANGAGIA